MIRYILSAPVKDGKLRSFRDWLCANEQRITTHCPKGWTLEGCYFGVYGLSDNLFEVHWTLASYGALDNGVTAAEKTENAKDGWTTVQEEWFDFLLTSGISSRLMKSVGDERLCVVAR